MNVTTKYQRQKHNHSVARCKGDISSQWSKS